MISIGNACVYVLKYFCSYTAKVLAIADKDEISEAAANHDDETEEDKKEEALEYYKVQLIDENSDGIDDCIKIVPNYKLK